jgi:hypothetical protein
MKKNYIEPEITVISTSITDILANSDNEIFVDAGNLFGE